MGVGLTGRSGADGTPLLGTPVPRECRPRAGQDHPAPVGPAPGAKPTLRPSQPGRRRAHVFSVPDVISSVTSTMQRLPLAEDSQKS